jgi:hypothetical protein
LKRIFVLAASLLFGSVDASPASGLRSDIEAYRSVHETEIVESLDALTRLRSIAADPAGLIATASTVPPRTAGAGIRNGPI